MQEQATYYLKTTLILLSNAAKYLDAFRREVELKRERKHFINTQLQRIENIERDMRMQTSPEFAAIIQKEISDNWETLSVQNVLGMMVQMDEEKRRVVEEFTEKLVTN